jgi:hypothetical protein
VPKTARWWRHDHDDNCSHHDDHLCSVGWWRTDDHDDIDDGRAHDNDLVDVNDLDEHDDDHRAGHAFSVVAGLRRSRRRPRTRRRDCA